MRSAKFLELPPELIQWIAEDIMPGDLTKLRLTCRTLYTQTWRLFLDILVPFRARHDSNGLDNRALLALSRSPFGNKVKRLCVSVPELRSSYGGYFLHVADKDFPEFRMREMVAVPPAGSSNDPGKAQKCSEQSGERSRVKRRPPVKVKHVLRSLRENGGRKLGLWSQDDWLFVGGPWGYWRVHRHQNLDGYTVPGRRARFQDLFYAMNAATFAATELKLGDLISSVPLDSFKYLSAPMDNLRRLELTIGTDWNDWFDVEPDGLGDYNSLHLMATLSRARRLMYLSITLDIMNAGKTFHESFMLDLMSVAEGASDKDFGWILHGIGFPKLRELKLDGFWIAPGDLVEFAELRKHTLTSLKVTNIPVSHPGIRDVGKILTEILTEQRPSADICVEISDHWTRIDNAPQLKKPTPRAMSA